MPARIHTIHLRAAIDTGIRIPHLDVLRYLPLPTHIPFLLWLMLLGNLLLLLLLSLRRLRQQAVHHAHAAGAQLVDRAHGVDGFVQRPTRVKVLLHRRQQILFCSPTLGTSDPVM